MSDASVTDDQATRRDPGVPSESAVAPVPTKVSRFFLLEEVGRGGMGRVVRAYDPKLQREVALKLLRFGAGDSAATQRMVGEARAMARLSHPNVVAVYDVEELDDGQVALVMEFIAGKTLKGWLRDESPQREEIISRFVDAGRGLAAAHAAGLLHRDFKPANVLVSGSTSKVTDFGIAKAIGSAGSGPEAGVETISADDLTVTGTIVGTPRYMAPEQHRGDSLDAATDQYAFCVALWEALCGEPPFRGKTLARDKMRGPPAWPNSRVPGAVSKAIVRGLSPNPEQRWPSMQALLRVLASGGTTRRMSWLVGGVGLVVVAAASMALPAAGAEPCTGAREHLTGIWDQTRRDELRASFQAIGKSYADEAWARTDRTLEAYARDWASAHTDACEATTIRGEQSPQMMDMRMACLHQAAVHLEAAVDVLSEADVDVARKAHKVAGDLLPLDRCANVYLLTSDTEPPADQDADAVEAARAQLAHARTLDTAGRSEPAQRSVEAATELLTDVDYGPVRSELALAEGRIHEALGHYDQSRTALEEAIRSGSTWKQWDIVQQASVQLLTVVGTRQQKVDEALSYKALASGLSIGNAKTEAAYRTGFASILMTKGEYANAEAEHRAALELRLAALGPEHPNVVASRHNVANALFAQGRHEAAEAEHRAALTLRLATLGADHPSVATSRSNLAGSLYAQGKLSEAEEEVRLALAVREAGLGPTHPEVGALRNNLATLLSAQGKHKDAEAEHRSALAMREATLGVDHPSNAILHNNLATVLFAQEKYAQAETQHRIALKMWVDSMGSDHPRVATSSANLAAVLLELDRPREAVPLARRAWEHYETDTNKAPHKRAEIAFQLARTLVRAGSDPEEHARARALATQARDLFASAGDSQADALEEVEAWLDEHP